MTRESPMRTSAGRSACTSPTAPKTVRRNSTALAASLTTMRGVTARNPGGRSTFMLRPPVGQLWGSVDAILGALPSRSRPSELRIEEHVQRRNLAVSDNDEIEPGVFGCTAFGARAPGQESAVVQDLRLSVRGLHEMRVG